MNDELPTQADLKALAYELQHEGEIAYIERAVTALCRRYEAYIAIHAPQATPPIDYVSVIVLVEKGEVRDGA